MKLLIYLLFPKLMPKKYESSAGITFTYNSTYDVFEGSNKVRVGIRYVVGYMKPKRISK